MNWNNFVYGIGDFLYATFKILPSLGNLPNILFSLILFGGLVYWIKQLGNYKAEAKRTGGIE